MPICPKCGEEVYSAVCPLCKTKVSFAGEINISEDDASEKSLAKYWTSVILLLIPAFITLVSKIDAWKLLFGGKLSSYRLDDIRHATVALFVAVCIALLSALISGLKKGYFRPFAIIVLIASIIPIFFVSGGDFLLFGVFMAVSALVVTIIGYSEINAYAVKTEDFFAGPMIYAGATIKKGLGDIKIKEEGLSAGSYKEGKNPAFVDLDNNKKGV